MNNEQLKITLAQINPTIGDMTGNVHMMLSAARIARDDGAQLVVFPELSLTGYHPGDLLDDESFCERINAGMQQAQMASRETPDLYWVIGAPVSRAKDGKDGPSSGKAFYNSLLVLKDGAIALSYNKQLLPTYNIFDEKRHFEPGEDVTRVLRIGHAQVGFLICEDGWNDGGKDYKINPFNRLRDAAPDIIVSINASPSNIGKREQRHQVFGSACKRHGIPLVYVNQIGGHDQLVFDGASFVVDAQGHVVFEAERFQADTQTITFDLVGRTFSTARNDEVLKTVKPEGLVTMEFYRRQIVLGIQDYARRCGFKKAVIGSSGGIDSALVLALAVQALGNENVNAITMPSRFSSQGSVSDSEALCANFGVHLDTVAIESIVNGFEDALGGSTLGARPAGLARENLQSRVRAAILMTYSNTNGHLLLTTGNKSEGACGFFTLGGDGTGGLGVIGDLYKTEVVKLCRHINATQGWGIIPTAIIEKPPSAELGPDQKDSDRLPPYGVLDEILKVLIEGQSLSQEEYVYACSFVRKLMTAPAGREMVNNVKRMLSMNEYKRRQVPPILRVRARAFGSGRQVPIAAKHY